MGDEEVLDRILVQIGDFGPAQLFAILQVCLIVILNSADHMLYVFTAMDSEYRCIVPNCDSPVPKYDENWLRNAVPFRNPERPVKCERYAENNSRSAVSVVEDSLCPASWFDHNDVKKCNSFVFENDEYYIGREFNMLCQENVWKLTLIGSINTAGMFTGLLFSGFISDKYGRKFVLMMSMILCGIIGMIKSLSPNYESFCILEFLESLSNVGAYPAAIVLGAEMVSPKSRVLTGRAFFTSYAIGEVLLGLVAWHFKDWRIIIYAICGPCILSTLLYWSIPESVRWYLSKGETEKAEQILKTFAKANGKKISQESLDKLKLIKIDVKESNSTISFIDLLKSKTLLIRFIICCFIWISCSFLFYGITLNSVHLSGDSYLDFIYISLTEIPAYWAVTYLIEKAGRRYCLSGSFLITVISCTSFIFLGEKQTWVNTIVYCLGKVGATSAFYCIYVMTGEIFPTPLRHTTMSLCSMIGRLGSISSPQTPLLSQLWQPFPLVLFATMSAISALMSLLLPETLNLKLPDTIEEAAHIGKKEIKEESS